MNPLTRTIRFASVVLTLLAAEASRADDVATSRSEVYKKTPQGELQIHLDLPSDWQATDRRPAIVFFFGGGWTGGKVEQFETQAKHLAGRGMICARADYRVKSRHKVTPVECVEDAKSAVRWLRQNAARLGIDPERIVSAGGSAGGHLAACTSLTPGLDAKDEDASISSQPNLLVLYNPVLNFTNVPSLASRVGDNAETARLISPTVHLTKATPPALLLYGSADKLIVQGEEFLARSKELGHRAEMFTAEGVGHGFFNRSPWTEKTTARVDEFLTAAGYLPPKP